ncbi:HAD family hydrolase [Pedobacter sp. ASV28]|uniref:HAD family hydrolase n=1 Tax=Pedobacter sp. ASV28 TaxID=2795123 RepID=UPI0018EA4778|nr:HAD family hydrolase [Pedobacter sp. ASV28]
MERQKHITTLFLDIGGVLLSDGWDRNARKDASAHFHIDHLAMEERHHINFSTYELGKLSLNDYLASVVFNEGRDFSTTAFKKFMFSQSKPLPNMLKLIRLLKKKYQLKIAAVSNEGRELNQYRIHKFRLDDIIDTFISSCFVHLSKPDLDLFRLAIDTMQSPVSKILYIENQPIFVANAAALGISTILHRDYDTTLAQLSIFGLKP